MDSCSIIRRLLMNISNVCHFTLYTTSEGGYLCSTNDIEWVHNLRVSVEIELKLYFQGLIFF